MMNKMKKAVIFILLFLFCGMGIFAQEPDPLSGTPAEGYSDAWLNSFMEKFRLFSEEQNLSDEAIRLVSRLNLQALLSENAGSSAELVFHYALEADIALRRGNPLTGVLVELQNKVRLRTEGAAEEVQLQINTRNQEQILKQTRNGFPEDKGNRSMASDMKRNIGGIDTADSIRTGR